MNANPATAEDIIAAINRIKTVGKMPDRMLIPDKKTGRYQLWRAGRKPTFNLNAKD